MNITSPLEQISKRANLNADLLLRQYKLNLMSQVMDTKTNSPKKTKSKQFSTSFIQFLQ